MKDQTDNTVTPEQVEQLIKDLYSANDHITKLSKSVKGLMESVDAAVGSLGARDTAHIQKLLTEMTAAFKECTTPTNKSLSPIKDGIMAQKMEDEGLEKADFEGIGKVVLTGDIFCTVKKDQAEKAQVFLIEHDQADMIKPTINSSALKSFMKKCLKEGEVEIPEEVFKVTPYTKSSIRKI